MVSIMCWFGSALLAICGCYALWAAEIASLDRLGAVVSLLRLWAESGADKPEDASVAAVLAASKKERALWLVAMTLLMLAMVAFASTAMTARVVSSERGWQVVALLVEAALASMALFWIVVLVAAPGMARSPTPSGLDYDLGAEAQTRGMPASVIACVAPEIDRLNRQITSRQARKAQPRQASQLPN